MPDFGMDRMAAMDKLGGRDMGSMAKKMLDGGGDEGPAGGDLMTKVEALVGNPEFARELEGLIAKFEGGGAPPGAAPAGPPPVPPEV